MTAIVTATDFADSARVLLYVGIRCGDRDYLWRVNWNVVNNLQGFLQPM